MRKGLGYYMSLPYAVEIVPIPEDQGGGYTASLPQFGTMGIVGDGDTEIESITNLKDAQCSRFQYYISKDIPIPEPDQYSGPTYKHQSELQDSLTGIIQEYYAALKRHEHGGVAQDRAMKKIEHLLGMRYEY